MVQKTIQVPQLPGLTCWARVSSCIHGVRGHTPEPIPSALPYLEGRCWAVLGLDLEGVLGEGEEPGHQGLEGCSQLCGKEWA